MSREYNWDDTGNIREVKTSGGDFSYDYDALDTLPERPKTRPMTMIRPETEKQPGTPQEP